MCLIDQVIMKGYNINKSIPREVERYLNKYASGNWKLESGGMVNSVKMAVVVPAIMEYDNLRRLLLSLAENDTLYFNNILVIFVINNLSTATDEVKENNLRSLETLRSIVNKETGKDEVAGKVISSGLRLDFIDASSKGRELPEKDGGVGFARKTGMDLALSVFDYHAPGKNILVCLDADCTVSKNYLTEVYENFQKRNLSAAVVNFRHEMPEDDIYANAITCYEIFLRYYVLGLKAASSPYTFHTIGSTMSCDYESYIKVEGMNKRKAAEDFYFMEKLAKNTLIEKINSATVYPSARGSWRVPFGTGQRVNRHIANTHNEYLLYAPQSFLILKRWLEIFQGPEFNDSLYYLNGAREIHPALHEFLVKQNFEHDYNGILRNSKKTNQLCRQKSSWFDGFRTLKLIHFLRDMALPPITMFKALDELLKMSGVETGITRKAEIPDLKLQRRYLEILREHD